MVRYDTVQYGSTGQTEMARNMQDEQRTDWPELSCGKLLGRPRLQGIYHVFSYATLHWTILGLVLHTPYFICIDNKSPNNPTMDTLSSTPGNSRSEPQPYDEMI